MMQASGLFMVLVIFIPQWYRGEELKESDSFSILTTLYILNFAINQLIVVGLINL